MKVFVYGSLKRGYPNHRYLEGNNSEFLGESTLVGHRLYHVSFFPGLVESEDPREIVHGETYDVSQVTLSVLDQLEGEGYLYKRQLITVLLDNVPVEAYAYLWLPRIPEDIEKVENNNWTGPPDGAKFPVQDTFD